MSQSSNFRYQANIHALSVNEARNYLAAVKNMPRMWPKQATINDLFNQHTVITWSGEDYPSVEDTNTGIDFDYPRPLDNYRQFCDRMQLLLADKKQLYFLYRLISWFKEVGGEFHHTQCDTAYRRGIPLEIIAPFQDIHYRDEQLSRFLSYLIRHENGQKQLQYHGIPMDRNGFVDIGLLIHKNPRQRLEVILPHQWDADFWFMMVNSNDKARYTIKKSMIEDGILIAAVQGHSISEIEATGETPIDRDNIPVEYVVHATTREAWQKIKYNGLIPSSRLPPQHGRNPRTRDDVHFVTVLPENNACRLGGLRKNAPVWIFVGLEQMFYDRLEPRLTLNSYVVTKHVVPSRLFACAFDIETKRDLITGWNADWKFQKLVEKSLQPPAPQEETIAEQDMASSAYVEPPTPPTLAERQEEERTLEAAATQEEPSTDPVSPPADPLASTVSSASEGIFYDNINEDERARRIEEAEVAQTEEEIQRAEGLILQLRALDIGETAESSSSAHVDAFAPMDFTPDWSTDDLLPPPVTPMEAITAGPLPPVPEHPEEEDDQRANVPMEVDQRHTAAPATPPKAFSIAAAWLDRAPPPRAASAPTAKKPPPPEWQEPFASRHRQVYLQK